MAPQQPPAGDGEAREARDVMAFGQEYGRVISDGRVVGRAEPFAKVFPSSRAVKRAVGLIAWAVLEDIALDARLDGRGRLVADTNVRRIADNLGLSKNAVARHLGALREYGFVLFEERRALGRFAAVRYVLDPSACIERFTHTPAARSSEAAEEPRPSSWDTAAVSHDMGHHEEGQSREGLAGDLREEQHQPRAGGDSKDLLAAAAVGRGPLKDTPSPTTADHAIGAASAGDQRAAELLVAVGVDLAIAADLVASAGSANVAAAVAAAPLNSRNRAGWIVAALRAGWDCTDRAAKAQRRERLAEERARDDVAALRVERAAADRAMRLDGWSRAVSAALDDRHLDQALGQVTAPVPGLERRSVPVARAQLVAWAVTAAGHDAGSADLPALLGSLLDRGAELSEPACVPDTVPPPPSPQRAARDLGERIRERLAALELSTARTTRRELAREL